MEEYKAKQKGDIGTYRGHSRSIERRDRKARGEYRYSYLSMISGAAMRYGVYELIA